MVLAIALTGAFIYIEAHTQTAQLTQAMKATANSLEEASGIAQTAREHYKNVSGTMDKSGQAIASLGPTVKELGTQTAMIGKTIEDINIPTGITIEGLKPALTWSKIFEGNRLKSLGSNFESIGETLKVVGPEMQKLAKEAPIMEERLGKISTNLNDAAKELRKPVAGRSYIILLAALMGFLVFSQSLMLFLMASRKGHETQPS